MSFNVTSAFTQSMPIVGPVGGFQNMMSRDFTQALGKIPFDNAASRLALADAAIKNQFALRVAKDARDARRSEFDAARSNSTTDMLRTAGMALLAGGGGGSSRAAVAQARGGTNRLDAAVEYANLERLRLEEQERDEREGGRVSRSAAAAAQSFGL